MLNDVMIVGKVQDLKQEQKTIIMKISVSRPFKNDNGEYESDILPVYIYGQIAETTKECIKINDMVEVKGRLQRINGNDFTANGYAIVGIIAEKVTFLSNAK